MDKLEVPVYLITGFLESGKTSFLQEIFESGEFADGERGLLISCEEGEVELDEKATLACKIDTVTLDEEEELTADFLENCKNVYKPKRVFVEYNGMWDPDTILSVDMPRGWEIYQIVTMIDASTFAVYLNNMRSLFSNMFQYTEMVIFNRCDESMDLHSYRRTVRSLNPRAMVYFEGEDGEPIDPGAEVPPFDFNADVINIEDMDYGLWFLDASDNPERYEGKTVRFLAKVMKSNRFPQGVFIPGRNAMTCCENDIRFVGYLCKAEFAGLLKSRQWIWITAEIRNEYAKEYGEEGPVLYGISYETAEKPADEVVYFN